MVRLPLNRRTFIRTLGAAGLAGASSPLLAAKTQKSLGVALVGLGYYSTDLLAPALQLTQHCHLAGIVTGSKEKAAQWQKQYNLKDQNIYHYDNFEQMANNDDIDVVYIVLPTSLHKEYTVRAAKIGKHVWCEKPMAMTPDECQIMIDACRQNRVKLTIGYRLQHEPNTQTIMGFAKKHTYGNAKQLMIAAGYRDTRTGYHWRLNPAMGGGAMYDMGVYPLNAARYATGEEPIAISARFSTERPQLFPTCEESTHYTLEFPSGALAHCFATFNQEINFLKAQFERGSYEMIPYQSYRNVKGVTSDGKKLNKTIANQQATQMDNDALAIVRNLPVLVPGEEGLRDIKVVRAAYESVANKARVEIKQG